MLWVVFKDEAPERMRAVYVDEVRDEPAKAEAKGESYTFTTLEKAVLNVLHFFPDAYPAVMDESRRLAPWPEPAGTG